MGWSPEQTGKASLWHFTVCWHGWLAAHRGQRGMDERKFNELSDMLDKAIEEEESERMRLH